MKPRGSAPLASLSPRSIDASRSSSQTWYFSYSGRELVAKISCRTRRAGFPDPIQTTVIAQLVFLHGCMWAPPKTELGKLALRTFGPTGVCASRFGSRFRLTRSMIPEWCVCTHARAAAVQNARRLGLWSEATKGRNYCTTSCHTLSWATSFRY